MFFLGEILLNVALTPTPRIPSHCGQCRACVDVCPTQAIVREGVVDARRCISYLTIEYDGIIDEDLRVLIGQHLYGCDDCQLICPWNKFAQPSVVADFEPRAVWQHSLVDYLRWSEETFLQYTQGSPIRRIGHVRWLRNAATVAGNTLRQRDDGALREALQALFDHPSPVVQAHVRWALSMRPLIG
jgi:epoxyqueuosine reductase